MEDDTPKFTDCHTPDYGYINQDGYVRVLTAMRKDGGKLKMRHRVEWEKENGPIPDKHEINHTCKNRACCRLDHLECLPTSVHRAKDNHLRYLDREKKVLQHKLDFPHLKQKELGAIFGLPQATISNMFQRNMIKWST